MSCLVYEQTISETPKHNGICLLLYMASHPFTNIPRILKNPPLRSERVILHCKKVDPFVLILSTPKGVTSIMFHELYRYRVAYYNSYTSYTVLIITYIIYYYLLHIITPILTLLYLLLHILYIITYYIL